MITITMNKTAAGPDGVLMKDRTYRVSADVAQPLLEAGAATPVRAGRETATMEPAERAVLGDVDGVGPERAADLAELGIETIEGLAGADVDALTAISGVGRVTARQMIAAARAALKEE